MQIIMIAVESREQGLDALDRLDDAVAEGRVTVEDAAMVYKNDKGKVKIHQTHDATAKRGAFRGGAVGLLVGIVAAPAVIAATAVGAGAGALIGKARDSGVSDKLMKQIGSYIEGNEAALFILADDSSSLTVSAVIEELMAGGADIDYEVIPPEAQSFLLEALKLGAAD
jgi:uncharacterized membrane protein